MKYNDLQKLISQPRLDRYFTACGKSKSKAMKLYDVNLRLAESYYPVLNLFEIILRNEIHYKLSSFFSNPDWIIVEKTGFMNDKTLKRSKYFLKNQVVKIENKLRKTGKVVTAGKIIAEQSLGFWTSLFEPHHYKLLKGIIIKCFPNKPSLINRSALQIRLQKIRNFRNRVYHNEPICFNGNTVDFNQAESIKKDIFDLLSWSNTTAKAYVEVYDNIDSQIAIGKNI